MTVNYNGYRLTPTPSYYPDTKKWSVRLTIEEFIKSGVRAHMYETTTVCDSEEDAIEMSIQHGRDIIDGKFPNRKLQ